jgi:hypothetical protein
VNAAQQKYPDMKIQSQSLSRALSLLAVGGCTLASAPTHAGGNPNPGIIPSHARYGGLSLGEWNVRLWQWLDAHLAFTPDSPAFDYTGANLGVDQSGPVWFLTLPAGPTSVREVTIPTGVALLVTVGSGSIGGLPLNPPTSLLPTLAEHALTDLVLNPELSIDGKPVNDLQSYAVVSPLFYFTLPEANAAGVPAGEYGPAVANGFTPLLAPLSAGHHVIHFSWDVAAGPFAGHWDETYLVIVVPSH